ncbi:alpha/beta fold hydrolase [Nocardia noduli]|uniref:alpha/beta fold hydrolase n=1 Tax=Nocardia noduli TaxID=2815722 RepID=UPI001C22E1D7|nr:alpha/beta hydrolase [Nocardia noduli]
MNSPRTARLRSAAAALTACLAIVAPPAALAGAQPAAPTVVLVHGAFADPSSWAAVADQLAAQGIPVRTFDNPLRSVAGDAAALTAFLDGIDGPIVLVGHSYGGAVISNVHDPDVKANVFTPAVAADLYAHQRTAALQANLEPSGPPSWAHTPSWYLVSTRDRVIPPALQRMMADRAAPGRTGDVDASHVSPVSRPDRVTAVIRDAVAATS